MMPTFPAGLQLASENCGWSASLNLRNKAFPAHLNVGIEGFDMHDY
jgi:hypothetical protein